MKQYITFLFLLFTTNLIGQARLGWTEKQIRTEFSNQTFTSDYADDGTKYISFRKQDYSVAYFFNNDGLCYLVFVSPYSQQLVNALVQKYNNEYVIISNTKWQYYTSGGIINIDISFPKDKNSEHPWFVFTAEPK